MSNSLVSKELIKKTEAVDNSYLRSVIIIGALFFIFACVSWLNIQLIRYLKIACEINNFESILISNILYISYLIMPVPSTWLLTFTGFKKGMSVGLLIIAIGCITIIPAAILRMYPFLLSGLFIQGIGLAVLQTASHPYIINLDPRESATKRLFIMGICNKLAIVIAPVILSSIILTNSNELLTHLGSIDAVQKAAELEALAARVITPYILMAAILAVLAVLLFLSGLPEVDTNKEDERIRALNAHKTSIFQFPHLLLGVLSVFLYMGTEPIVNYTIIHYAHQYQGIPLPTAAYFPTFTLIAMIAGCLIGIAAIPKFISQENALKAAAVLGLMLVLAAISTNGLVSVSCVALLGLANAFMWPIIWPLAIADLGRFTRIGSSLLVMAISGGILLPLAYRPLAAILNQQQAYSLLIPCYLFIWYFAAAGHKIRIK